MKTRIIILLAALLCSTAYAQTDLVNGNDSKTEFILGIYPSQNPSGNQDWVQEYDGRKFDMAVGVEKFEAYGYNGPLAYSLQANDLTLADEDVRFNGMYANTFGIKLSTSALTHRRAPYYGANSWLVGTPGAGLDPYVKIGDANPSFLIKRRVNQFDIRTTPESTKAIRLVLENWQQTKTGPTQVVARFGSPSAKRSAVIQTDSVTTSTTLGADAAIGRESAINFRNIESQYEQRAGRGVAGTVTGVKPLDRLTRVDSKTSTQVYKLRTKLGKSTYVTGAQTYSRRTDPNAPNPAIAASSTLPAIPSGSLAANTTSTTNLAVTTLLGDSTTITAGYKRYDQKGNAYNYERSELAVGKNKESVTIDATYTGIKKTYLKAGYESQTTNYKLGEDPAAPWLNTSNKANIFRAGLRMHPTDKLNIQSNFENWDGNSAVFQGTKKDRTKFDFNTTYMLKDNLAIYGIYNQTKDKNGDIRIDPVPIVGTAADVLTRFAAAGQNYKGDLTSTIIGSWFAVNSQLTLDLSWSNIGTRAQSLWVLAVSGTDQQDGLVPFNTDNDQWNVGATYQINPVWRVRCAYLDSASRGKATIHPKAGTSVAAFGPDWLPISVHQEAWSLGLSREISKNDSLDIDFSLASFNDKVDPSNSGDFGLWRIGWTRSF